MNHERKHDLMAAPDDAKNAVIRIIGPDPVTVTQLEAQLDDPPEDRRRPVDLEAVVARSVFGLPEPAAPGTRRVVHQPPVEAADPPRLRRVIGPADGGVPRANRFVVAPPVAPVDDPDRRRRITGLLAVLFLVALVASVGVTLFTGDDQRIDAGSDPVVDGVTTVPTVASTTMATATTLAPTTTTALTTTTAPTTTAAPTTTTAAPTTTTTTAPTTTAPTTTVATTRRPATTARPTTTRAPTTQLTIPEVTFSQPTWAGTGG